MKKILLMAMAISLLGVAACSNQSGSTTKDNTITVQDGENQTRIDNEGNISVKTEDSEVTINNGNVSVQSDDGTSVKIEGGNISIQGLDKYMNSSEDEKE